MPKKKKVKTRTKVVYVEKKPSIDTGKLKQEIQELKQEKERIAKKTKEGGAWTKFRGVLAQGAINKQIGERARYIRGERQLPQIKQEIELEKAKTELAELRKKRQVDFDSLGFGFGSSKPIKQEDIFK